MKKKYLLLSGIEGACVMAAEIVSAKLLAPFYGSSLYVWSSILAITLGGLALGYFYGGVLSTKTEPAKRLRQLLYLAVLFMVFMPFISYYIIPRISYLSMGLAIVLSALILVMPPLFFLGSTSPLFIKLQTASVEESGKVGGTVYAVSTVGGIIASFLCGFYLIPELGLRITILSFAVVLALSTFFILRKIDALVFMIPLAFFFQFKSPEFKNNLTSLFHEYGILGECEVNTFNNKDGKVIRQLSINKIIQTEMEVETGKSLSDYLKQLDTLIPIHTNGKALVLGLGGGLSANLLCDKGYQVEAVELDERVIFCAKEFFNLNTSVTTIDDDARHFINSNKKKYDIILIDVFKAEEQPSHVLTQESLALLKNNLVNDSSEIWINWHGYITGDIAKGTTILMNTLKNANFELSTYTTSKPENQRNTLFKARLISQEKSLNATTELANTDDKPCLEKANANANKQWREQYLRYFQYQ